MISEAAPRPTLRQAANNRLSGIKRFFGGKRRCDKALPVTRTQQGVGQPDGPILRLPHHRGDRTEGAKLPACRGDAGLVGSDTCKGIVQALTRGRQTANPTAKQAVRRRQAACAGYAAFGPSSTGCAPA